MGYVYQKPKSVWCTNNMVPKLAGLSTNLTSESKKEANVLCCIFYTSHQCIYTHLRKALAGDTLG